MRIVIFSTNSNKYDKSTVKTVSIPSRAQMWNDLALSFPEHEFIVATQLPGSFLLDYDFTDFADINTSDPDAKTHSKSPEFFLIKSDDESEIADFIARLHPDAAIAATFYVTPFDWLCVKDAIVAEKLREKGIKTICHSVQTALDCFDKQRTHVLLEKYGFNCAKAVYVNHAFFACGGNRQDIKSNVYKKSVFFQIERLKYPVIIKDTVGLSSYGATVLDNFDQAKRFLLSKRNTSDKIIEEMIQGKQFGCEIHGTKGNYKVFAPFLFSVNKYGITSPKQSLKIGPIDEKTWDSISSSAGSEKNAISQLKSEMLRLAEAFEFDGIAQVDLAFSNGKWFVIEINPRLSGMSETYAVLNGTSVAKMLAQIVLESFNCDDADSKANRQMRADFSCRSDRFVINIKSRTMPLKMLNKLKTVPDVKYIYQIENLAANQKREQGYCEVIIAMQQAAKSQ